MPEKDSQGGEAEFSGGGGLDPFRQKSDHPINLGVSVSFADTDDGGPGGGASQTEHPAKSAVTITIPTNALVKLLASGGLRLGVENTTIDVPLGTGEKVTVHWE